MKLLITGSRNYHNYQEFKSLLEYHFPNIEMILHGGATGADSLAARYAKEEGLPTKVIRPNYNKYPPHLAPLMRNTELVKLADATFAIYADEKRGGTKDTANKTIKAGKPLTEYFQGQVTHQSPQLSLF